MNLKKVFHEKNVSLVILFESNNFYKLTLKRKKVFWNYFNNYIYSLDIFQSYVINLVYNLYGFAYIRTIYFRVFFHAE